MMTNQVKNCYTSCCCNRLPHTADWGKNELICFASYHSVVVYDPKLNNYGLILSTLHGHSDRVNSVFWIKTAPGRSENEIVSASSDGTAIIWTFTNKECTLYTNKVLKMNQSISYCDAIYLSPSNCDKLIVTYSINGNLYVWLQKSNNEAVIIQKITFQKAILTELKLTLLPNKTKDYVMPLLLAATDECSISLYSTELNISQKSSNKIFHGFQKIETLSGYKCWITSIDTIYLDVNTLMVASGLQNGMIYVWKIELNEHESLVSNGVKLKKQQFFLAKQKYEITLDSILSGHDASVNGLQWNHGVDFNSTSEKTLKLLSCSQDKTAIIWKENKECKIWSDIARLGNISDNSSEYYCCRMKYDGKSILITDYYGQLHLWEYEPDLNVWRPRVAPGGHFSNVVDLCWEPDGRYLITTSLDQTTRIHAPWKLDNGEYSWHQISRPQIHGYGLTSLAILGAFKFASGAEEKVIRVFEAPEVFKDFFRNSNSFLQGSVASTLPVLGLTNKAIIQSEPQVESNLLRLNERFDEVTNFNVPPSEGVLAQFTLWPEVQKLYGHNYEIFAMATSNNKKLLATSAKTKLSKEHSAIILWDTCTWSQHQKLSSHELTVTQIAFSPDDQSIVSVSRDRRWSLFCKEKDKDTYTLQKISNNNFHTRIVWCCAWTHDSAYFATGSRDAQVGIWDKNSKEFENCLPVAKLKFSKEDSIRAIAFSHTSLPLEYILAIGFENGIIDLRKLIRSKNTYEWIPITILSQSIAHHLAIRRLSFRPNFTKEKKLQLASCGDDTMVKIFDIYLE
ncbi:probable elongator complex protein 2 [Trichogramma pretiosum]|uniref:probable elongator complex protein 2 n=1 Tax=Trichogramma pretiosum TaxID=7493 RepID=UPI0006C9B1C7|nr:probable elongator complex protein 2 [Trichogramma pretiosum]